MTGAAGRVLLTVSGVLEPDARADIAAGRRPRADYFELADAFAADVVDHADALDGRAARVASKLVGMDVLLAWTCFRRRKRYETVFTDGEQVGLPFAAMCWLARRRPRHTMIVHRLSPLKKVLAHRLLNLRHNVDRLIVYASAQRSFAIDALHYRPEQVTLTPFMVDTDFWSADRVTAQSGPRPMICSVGLELRDYATFIDAVRDLDVDVVVAAASPWSKRGSTAHDTEMPDNVRLQAFSQFDLRQLYADSAFVVVPIEETDFQAGITTILEAMAMGRAVICTRTSGQTDTIVDGVTGLYVPPGDSQALRAAISSLLANPAEADRLGAASRTWARTHADITIYAATLAATLTM